MVSTSDIKLTAGMRNNLLLLQRTNSQIETVQNRLATGNKINSALDGPTNFFAAKGLSTRSGDLSKLKEAMGQAISTIQAGDKGITAIEKLVEQARGLTTSAYGTLGNDPQSIATRKNLAEQFNRIKEQIDRIAQDSGYQGKNLLVGDGLQMDSTAASRTAVNSITGVSGARVTNVVSADTYSVSISGTGDISGNASNIAEAEKNRGLTQLEISGSISATQGNFSDISIEMRGSDGRERTVVVTEAGESRTIKFFDDSQSAEATLQTAGRTGTAQVSQVTISGDIEEGDTFSITVNGRAYTYEATAADVASTSQDDRRNAIATGLNAALNADLPSNGSGAMNITVTNNVITLDANTTQGTGVTFSVGATTSNAELARVSLSFSSGTVIRFNVDRLALKELGTQSNGTSIIEKNVDIEVTATNLNGVSVTRSGANDRGNGKLTDGENAIAFDSGTVRLKIDEATIRQAASAQRTSNLITVQRTDPNTSNDLSVQFNESNTSQVTVKSVNIQTDGQGLRLDYAQNNFLDRADIDKAVESLDFATATLRSASQSLSTNLNIIKTREDFTAEFTNVLTEGANKLVQADQNEEGATLLTLQTRQQLGTISLSLANQSQQAILRLF